MSPTTIAAAIKQINAELTKPRNPDEVNFWVAVQSARNLIALAAETKDERAIRSAAAAYGGLVKRWRRYLIEQLTAVAFAGKDTSRTRVREWQRLIFGQAVASSRLSQYARSERSGGGRAEFVAPTPALEQLIKDHFLKFKDRIKSL